MDNRSSHPPHPPRESFRKLIDGAAASAEAREIVRHLMAGCPDCTRAAQEARSATPSTPGSWSYDAVFERLERNLTREIQKRHGERTTAQQLFAELLGHEAVEGLLQVQGTRAYASLALCELLLQKSQALYETDPVQARTSAELARLVAEQLDLGLYGASVVQDLRALAWIYFVNASRIEADLRSAESSLELARQLEELGGDASLTADLLTLKASLLSYGGRFEEAMRALNRVASIYRKMGERHLLGRTMIQKGAVLGNAGKPEAAARLIRRGIDLIDAAREPRLMVCATHNLIWFLNESGRSGQALDCLDGARRLYERAGDRRDLGRLRWLEGKLAPRLEDAEKALLDARDRLLREGLSYEAALAALDLAMLYAGERRAADMRRQTDQMLPLFRSGDMYREAVVALLSFQQGESAAGPAGFLAEMGIYLRRAWEEKNPKGLAPAAGA